MGIKKEDIVNLENKDASHRINFAWRIIYEMTEQKLTIENLSEQLSIEPNRLLKYLTGLYNFRLTELTGLETVLGIQFFNVVGFEREGSDDKKDV